MNRTRALVATALAVPALVLPAAVASAGDGGRSQRPEGVGTEVFRAQLEELNDSGATGTVKLQLRGDQLTVRIKADGLTPNQPHAQHIHGVGNSECPTDAADTNGDGLVDVLEGVPFYGGIAASLTTRDDTSPAAGLTLEIMPVADDKGRIDYTRTFTVPAEVAGDLSAYQIVQHGVDLNGNQVYDFEAGPSELSSAFPLEGTLPANCGTIDHVGHGHQH